jgi:hypothetical protein
MSARATYKGRTQIIVGFVLATAAVFWVALLMGFASGLLTNG